MDDSKDDLHPAIGSSRDPQKESSQQSPEIASITKEMDALSMSAPKYTMETDSFADLKLDDIGSNVDSPPKAPYDDDRISDKKPRAPRIQRQVPPGRIGFAQWAEKRRTKVVPDIPDDFVEAVKQQVQVTLSAVPSTVINLRNFEEEEATEFKILGDELPPPNRYQVGQLY